MKSKTPTQCDLILAHLKRHEFITPLDALNRYGCFRLAARINDLKNQGYQIESKPWTTPGGAKVAKYILKTSTDFRQADLPHIHICA